MPCKSNNKFDLFSYSILLAWLGLSLFLYCNSKNPLNVRIDFFSVFELLLDLFMIYFSLKIYKKSNTSIKKYFFFLYLSFISLTITDISIYILFSLLKLSDQSDQYATVYTIPFLLFLFCQIIFFLGLIKQNIIQNSDKLYIVSFLTIFSFFAMAIFLMASTWQVNYFSYLGLYDVFTGAVEFIIFDLAIIILICSKNKGLNFISSAVIILAATNLWEKYLFESGKLVFFSFNEVFWVLGQCLIIIGLIYINQNKSDFCLLTNSLRKIKSLISLWIFALMNFSFLILFFIGYAVNLINKNSLMSLPFLMMLYAVVVVLISNFIGSKFEKPFDALKNNIENLTNSLDEKTNIDLSKNLITEEFTFLQRFIVSSFQLMHAKNKEKQLLTKQMADLGKFAAQVSHDIRSPLTALDMLVENFSDLPEDKRILARSATNRIKDIANNLLEKNRNITKDRLITSENHPEKSNEPKSIQQVASLIEKIISEKRLLLFNKPGIQIHFKTTMITYTFFAEIQPTEFERAISNLLNNAIEILEHSGVINVQLDSDETKITLRISDNGRGIPPEVLNKLGHRGTTQGKVNGNGLGIFHARSSIESVGGSFHIESALGSGTSIIIILPKADNPAWFVPTVKLSKNSAVFILDDDFSIKEIWRQRFEQLNINDHQIEAYYFSTPNELEKEMTMLNKSKPDYYLLDYEIIGSTQTGLDVAEKLQIGTKTILVTSRWDEQLIQDRCTTHGIRLLPKSLAGIIPIEIASSLEKFDGVLLDDDPIIATVWTTLAIKNNKKFISYTDPDRFFEALTNIDKDSPIFIDSQLKNNVKGQNLIPKVFALGFKKIYLATGYEPDYFPEIPGLTAIIGKSPPKEIC